MNLYLIIFSIFFLESWEMLVRIQLALTNISLHRSFTTSICLPGDGQISVTRENYPEALWTMKKNFECQYCRDLIENNNINNNTTSFVIFPGLALNRQGSFSFLAPLIAILTNFSTWYLSFWSMGRILSSVTLNSTSLSGIRKIY